MDSNVIYLAFGDGGAGEGGKGDGGKAPCRPGAPSCGAGDGEGAPAAPAGGKGPREETASNGEAKMTPRTESSGGFHLQGEHSRLVDLYTRGQAARLLGIEEGRLRWWDRCGLVVPTRRYGRDRYYTFEDLVLLRAAGELVARGCAVRSIKKAIAKLAEEMPFVEKPLTKMRVQGNARRLVIRREGREEEVDSGQVLIDFAVAQVATSVSWFGEEPQGGAAGPDGKSTYEWFMEGVAVEQERGAEGYDDALRAYLKALEAEPGFAPALTNIGNIRKRQGDAREAEGCYREAIRCDPSLAQPYYNLGCLKLEQGDPFVATVYLRKAQELDPEFPDVYFNLALACEQQGKKDEAAGFFARFLEMETGSEWSELAREHLAALGR